MIEYLNQTAALAQQESRKLGRVGKKKSMEQYLNKSGNSPITHYEIGTEFILVRFKGGKDYIYSYNGKAGSTHVENMKTLAINGSGLSAYITKYVKFWYD